MTRIALEIQNEQVFDLKILNPHCIIFCWQPEAMLYLQPLTGKIENNLSHFPSFIMSQLQSKYIWSFNRFLPQFGVPLSAAEYLVKDNSKHTLVQYYKFLEQQYSIPLQRLFSEIYPELNIPTEIVNIMTVYNSGGIIYDYTKSFEQYTTGNVVYITPLLMGYVESFLFIVMFVLMFLIHFQFQYDLFAFPSATLYLSNSLLILAISYSLLLCIHTVCVLISYRQCKRYEIIIRQFKASLYSNKNFSHHIRMIHDRAQQRSQQTIVDIDLFPNSSTGSNQNRSSNRINQTAAASARDGGHQRLEHQGHQRLEMRDLDSSESESESTDPRHPTGYHYDEDMDVSVTMTESDGEHEDGIMDRWQWTSTYNNEDHNDYLYILNPSNNSFAYVAYQRWLNVKRLELDNDSFTRSKSALVLNLSKYWLTSYFVAIIVLIFLIPNSVYLYFGFVLTLFVMYYCYLRTVKRFDHRQALRKVMWLFCSFVVGTIITLIIIFTTEDVPKMSTNSMKQDAKHDANAKFGDQTNGTDDTDVTFWIFDVVFPVLEGTFASLYSYITLHLLYRVLKYDQPGYHLWCAVRLSLF